MKLLFSIEQLQRRSLTSCLTHNMPRCKNNVSSSSAGQQKRNSRGQLKSIKVAVHKYMYVILYRLADMSQPTSPIIKRRTKHLFKNKLQDEDTDDIVIPGTPQKPRKRLFKLSKVVTKNNNNDEDKVEHDGSNIDDSRRNVLSSNDVLTSSPPLILSPHVPSSPLAFFKSYPHAYSPDYFGSPDFLYRSKPENGEDPIQAEMSQSLLAISKADERLDMFKQENKPVKKSKNFSSNKNKRAPNMFLSAELDKTIFGD